MAAEDKVIGYLDELLRKSGREPYLDMPDYTRGNASWLNGPVGSQQTIAIHSISVLDAARAQSKIQIVASGFVLLFASSRCFTGSKHGANSKTNSWVFSLTAKSTTSRTTQAGPKSIGGSVLTHKC